MMYPVRKRTRLRDFDYSSPNVYFITICTEQKKPILGEVVGATNGRPPTLVLSDAGNIVHAAIQEIPCRYSACALEHFVVMPNHVHLLLRVSPDESGRPMVAPTISTVVAQLKGAVSKRLGKGIWQKGFHDHIVRTERDYADIWQYIEDNPLKWEMDKLYVPRKRSASF